MRFLYFFLAIGSLMSNVSLAAPQGTPDVIYGLDNPTQAQWTQWRAELDAFRAQSLKNAAFSDAIYRDPRQAWSDTAFRQYFLFMYDQEFFRDGKYRTRELIETLQRRFGKIDSVLLWHAYPQLGFDHRTQFDFYRQMPGGLAGLRHDVVDLFHVAGIRVFVDFNPWDLEDASSQYRELAEVVAALDADGVMLDTLPAVPDGLKAAVDAARPGTVYSPEDRPTDSEMSRVRESWAQWFDRGDANRPSVYRQKWLVPSHVQSTIARWDTDRHEDIVYSFFNGTGLLIWDNVFGTWNPYSAADRRLIAETSLILRQYGAHFARGRWSPLVPTGVSGLDANRWDLDDHGRTRTVLLFRNRTDHELSYSLPHAKDAIVAWPEPTMVGMDGIVRVAARGTQALVLGETSPRFAQLRKDWAALAPAAFEKGYEERTPVPSQAPLVPAPAAKAPDGFVAVPGGSFTMRIDHMKRESGCYPFGADDDAMWGWFYKDMVHHAIPSTVKPFAIRMSPVTNAEYLRFVRESGFRPADPEEFIKLAASAPPGDAVTYVSLADARAYARWKGERLPTEAEWQWAAESLGPSLEAMSGANWELTESEWSDGHTPFVMLRGGIDLPPGEDADWMVPRGAHAPQFHAKYLLMGDRIERSEKITFRTVVDLP